MARDRRHAERPTPHGITAIVVVAPDRSADHAQMVTACRRALRDTDAVLQRGASGTIAVLIRQLGDADHSCRSVAERVQSTCEAAAGTRVRLGVAVAEDDEPLDTMLKRASQALITTD